jgi:hypothetical protein
LIVLRDNPVARATDRMLRPSTSIHRRIAAGAEWLLPLHLKIENETRQARAEQCELERIKRLGRQLETECGMARNY